MLATTRDAWPPVVPQQDTERAFDALFALQSPPMPTLRESVRIDDPYALDAHVPACQLTMRARLREQGLDALVALVAYAVLVPLLALCRLMLHQHRRQA